MGDQMVRKNCIVYCLFYISYYYRW